MKRLMILGATALLAFAAIACSGASANDSNTGGPLPDGEMETKIVTAPVLEAEIEVRESAPPQYGARVLVEIGDGCHAFERVDVERDGETIAITVFRTAPAHPELVLCTMQYQTHEAHVDLGSDFESGREYTVVLNGGEQTLTFVAQ